MHEVFTRFTKWRCQRAAWETVETLTLTLTPTLTLTATEGPALVVRQHPIPCLYSPDVLDVLLV